MPMRRLASESPPTSRGTKLVDAVLLVAIALAGGVLRAVLALRRAIWVDEAVTTLAAALPGDAWVDISRNEHHPPLYYLLQRGWLALTGVSPFTLRLPSVVAGAAASAAAAWLVRAAGGQRPAALLAAALVAVHPTAVYYGAEARDYALVTLGFAFLAGALARAACTPDGVRWYWCAAAATVLLAWTSFLTAFAAFAWLVALAIARRCGPLWGAAVVAAAGSATAVLWPAWQAVPADAYQWWMRPLWPGLGGAALASMHALAGVPPFPRYLGELHLATAPESLGALGALCWVVPLAGAPVVAWRRFGDLRATGAPAKRVRWIVAAAALAPPVALWVGAAATAQRWLYLPGRYETVGIVCLAALWALCVDDLARRWRRAAAVAWALPVVLTVASASLTTAPPVARANAQVADLTLRQHDESPIVATTLAYAPVAAYAVMRGGLDRIWPFPAAMREHPGWWAPHRVDPAALTSEAHALANRWTDSGYRDLWLVVPLRKHGELPPAGRALFGALRRAAGQPGRPYVFGRLGVVRFSRSKPVEPARGDGEARGSVGSSRTGRGRAP